MKMVACVGTVVLLAGSITALQEIPPSAPAMAANAGESTLDSARRMFYNARYEEAAALALELCTSSVKDLEACELRTSTLHFQIRRALGDAKDKGRALKACAVCPGFLSAFTADTALGRAIARETLTRNPEDESALFLLGKIDLNYVWLQLATLDRKTGWSEYWEARRSLDRVLKMNPGHVRARVARAWIDYIVDTKMPFGTEWLLGGGNKNRGLRMVREAASGEGDFFEQAEAGFALWDMQVRERDLAGAVETARDLARDFPDNRELVRFLATHAAPEE